MPTAPLIAAAFAASMVTCFAPEQDCARLATSAIDAARHEILVNAYALTTGSGIPAALIRAHDRNVDVRLVADRRAPCDLQEGVDALAAAGIPIWIDVRARMAHEEALIIDRGVTIMGSYNWTKGAARNSEDLNVVTLSEVAETYARHWQPGQAVSIRFVDASNGAGDDRVGSARHRRYRRLVPVTTINQAGISRDPRDAARSSRTRLIGGRGAFSLAQLAGDLLEDGGAVALASSLAAELAIAANFVALHRLTSGFPRVGRHLVRGPAGASVAVGKGGRSVVFGSPGSAIIATHGSLSATPRRTYAASPVL